MSADISFSPTTFMAVPRAWKEASLTSGVVSLIVYIEFVAILYYDHTYEAWAARRR